MVLVCSNCVCFSCLKGTPWTAGLLSSLLLIDYVVDVVWLLAVTSEL